MSGKVNFNPHHRKVVTFGVQPLTGSLTDFNPHHRKVVTADGDAKV